MNPDKSHIQSLSDEDLVRLIQSGEDRGDIAFRVIFERHSKWLFNKCVQFVGTHDASDLSQEIFVKIYMNLGKFRFNSKFSTWLFTITYRMCVDETEKRARNKMQEQKYYEETKGAAGYASWDDLRIEEAIMSAKAEHIDKIMNMIEPLDKAVLLMKYQDDMKIRDISATLNSTEGSVKMRLRRAKEKVLTIYKKETQNEKSI